jgi:ankyrin repeat protein
MSSRTIRIGVTLFALLFPSPATGQGLHQAIQAGDVDQVKSLLREGADPNEVGPRGLSAVDLAFWMDCQRDSEILEVLLDAGGQLEPDAPWPLPVSRLHLAATFGHADLARLLLELGTDPNQRGRNGETALLMAARGGHRALQRVLLGYGADVEIPDAGGGTAVTWAVERGHGDVVRDLLEAGAPVGYTSAETNQTLLHLAALGGHLGIVRTLLTHGVPTITLDAQGHPPLYYAGRYGHRQVADLLLAEGADDSGMSGARFGRSPILSEGPGEGEAALWYLNHRGWAVKTADNFLVFDQEEFGVNRPTQPALANGFLTPAEIGDQNVTAFYTCYHGEIGEPAYIHQIEDSLKSVVYVQNAGDRWRGSERSVYLSPRDSAILDHGKVTVIGTMTQMATLGHLVEVDGLILYYQGFNPDDMEFYRGELEFLADVTDRVDVAFLPIPDSRHEAGELGFKAFVDRFRPRAIALLDPGRREERYPDVAEMVRSWGYEGEVFTARHPGDVFRFTRSGASE